MSNNIIQNLQILFFSNIFNVFTYKLINDYCYFLYQYKIVIINMY